jgi:hypothetical protein
MMSCTASLSRLRRWGAHCGACCLLACGSCTRPWQPQRATAACCGPWQGPPPACPPALPVLSGLKHRLKCRYRQVHDEQRPRVDLSQGHQRGHGMLTQAVTPWLHSSVFKRSPALLLLCSPQSTAADADDCVLLGGCATQLQRSKMSQALKRHVSVEANIAFGLAGRSAADIRSSRTPRVIYCEDCIVSVTTKALQSAPHVPNPANSLTTCVHISTTSTRFFVRCDPSTGSVSTLASFNSQ